MITGKYLIVNGEPILLSKDLMHNSLDVNPSSAGFFMILPSGGRSQIVCWGERSSLNIQSKPEEDQEIIMNKLFIK
jgi:hypothetical protein